MIYYSSTRFSLKFLFFISVFTLFCSLKVIVHWLSHISEMRNYLVKASFYLIQIVLGKVLTLWGLKLTYVIYEDPVPTSQSTECSCFVGMTNVWVLRRVIIGVYCKNHVDYLNALCGQMQAFNVEPGCMCSNH
jgi:hypothetical protein